MVAETGNVHVAAINTRYQHLMVSGVAIDGKSNKEPAAEGLAGAAARDALHGGRQDALLAELVIEDAVLLEVVDPSLLASLNACRKARKEEDEGG